MALIDAAKVKGRRKLRFDTLAEALAEATELCRVGAEVRPLANMNAAQAVEHLARWVDASVEALPLTPPPLPLRLIAPLLKGMVLNQGLPAGSKLPEDVQSHFTPAPDTQASQAMEHYRAAVAAFHQAETLAPSMLFGKLSRQEWEKLHCRHAELHFSFLLRD